MKENPLRYHPFAKEQSIGTGSRLSVNKNRTLVIFVLDESGSMRGPAISNLNTAVNRFASEIIKKNISIANDVEMFVIAFDDTPRKVLDWTPLGSFRNGSVNLSDKGGTNIGSAIDYAFEQLENKWNTANYSQVVSHIVLISDGDGGSVDAQARRITELTKNGKLKFWMLGVTGYNKATANKLTAAAPKRLFELNDGSRFDFSPFFSELISGITTDPDPTNGGDNGPRISETTYKMGTC